MALGALGITVPAPHIPDQTNNKYKNISTKKLLTHFSSYDVNDVTISFSWVCKGRSHLMYLFSCIHDPNEWRSSWGTIPILRQQLSSFFWPTQYVSINTAINISKNFNFLNPLTESFCWRNIRMVPYDTFIHLRLN